jgi:PTS system glucitol/sorbitol-specific IIC component
MDVIVNFFQAFINVFNLGGENLVNLITSILPTLACLMTCILAIVKFIGEERIEMFAQKASKYLLLRYTVLPVLAFFVFTNPMNYTIGRFLPEKYKGSFFDASCAIAHPITGLFPHCNSGELFIWLGISSGVATLGYSTTALAVRYLLAGLVLALLRGIITEKLWAVYAKRNGVENYDSNEVIIEA